VTARAEAKWSISPSAILFDTAEISALAARLSKASAALGGFQKPPRAPELPAPCVDLNALMKAPAAVFDGVSTHLSEMAAQLVRRMNYRPPEAYPFVASTLKEGGAELAKIIRGAKSDAERAVLFNRMGDALSDPKLAKSFFTELGGKASYELISQLDDEDFLTASTAFAAATKEGLPEKFRYDFLVPSDAPSEKEFARRVDTILGMLEKVGAKAFGDSYLVDLGPLFLPAMAEYTSGFKSYEEEATKLLKLIAANHSASAKLIAGHVELLLSLDVQPWSAVEGMGGEGLGALLASAGEAPPKLAHEALSAALEAASSFGVANKNVAQGLSAMATSNSAWLTDEVLGSLPPPEQAKSPSLAKHLRDMLVSARHWPDQAGAIETALLRESTAGFGDPPSLSDVQQLGKALGFVRGTMLTTTFRQAVVGEDEEAMRRTLARGLGGIVLYPVRFVPGGQTVVGKAGGALGRIVLGSRIDSALGGAEDDVKEVLKEALQEPALSEVEWSDLREQYDLPQSQRGNVYEALDRAYGQILDVDSEQYNRFVYNPAPLVPVRK
jgi:hypothetical protein